MSSFSFPLWTCLIISIQKLYNCYQIQLMYWFCRGGDIWLFCIRKTLIMWSTILIVIHRFSLYIIIHYWFVEWNFCPFIHLSVCSIIFCFKVWAIFFITLKHRNTYQTWLCRKTNETWPLMHLWENTLRAMRGHFGLLL